MRDLGLTLAGGGNRSLYQQALLTSWADRLWPRTAAIASVSAGAAIAALVLSGRAAQARQHFDELRRGLVKNFDWKQLLHGEPVAPHGRIFHSTVRHAMLDGGLERIRAWPCPVWVLCAIPPKRLPIPVAAWLAITAYELEKRVRRAQLHPGFGRQLGFEEFVFDMRDCRTPDEVADLVLASSSTPPFTTVGTFRGVHLVDGGIIDNVPASLVERDARVKRNLVMLTRIYPEGVAGMQGQRLYLEPSAPVQIRRWDYTQSAPMDEPIELGRADAERFAERIDQWLALAPQQLTAAGVSSGAAQET